MNSIDRESDNDNIVTIFSLRKLPAFSKLWVRLASEIPGIQPFPKIFLQRQTPVSSANFKKNIH